GADHDHAAVGTGDGAFDQEQVVIAVELDDAEVARGGAGGAVAAGHALALLGAATAAIAGMGADAAGGAVVLFDAVAGGQPGEAVPLHDPGRAATLAGAG